VVGASQTRFKSLPKARICSRCRSVSCNRDLRTAIHLARPIGDPALFLRAATTLLTVDGDDLLLLETRTEAGRILAELPDAEMRQQFEAAEPVRRLGGLQLDTTAKRLEPRGLDTRIRFGTPRSTSLSCAPVQCKRRRD